ncbi:MAG: hypothetical protein WDM90_20385 [Ferruginibacter sp.]
MKKLILFATVLLFIQNLQAQTTLPIPVNIKKAFDKGTRSADGKPGKNYWQNHAVYNIDVNFEPTTRLVKGVVNIDYTNNSNDTLKEIVFKLYPNIYKKGAERLMEVLPEDVSDGVAIEKLAANDEVLAPRAYRINATNMSVRIKPLLPKQTIKFNISYSYTLNKKIAYKNR